MANARLNYINNIGSALSNNNSFSATWRIVKIDTKSMPKNEVKHKFLSYHTDTESNIIQFPEFHSIMKEYK